MKFLIALLVLSTSAFAQDFAFTQTEQQEILDYLDEVCPDTYCAGDLNYFPQEIMCIKDRCTVSFYATEHGPTSQTFFDKLPMGLMRTSIENKDVSIKYYSVNKETRTPQLNFSCSVFNIPSTLNSAEARTDYMYYSILSCVDQLGKDLRQ